MELARSASAGFARDRAVDLPLRRGAWLRRAAVIAAALYLALLVGAYVRLARGASHSLMVYRSADDPGVLTVGYEIGGLAAGDRVLAVDGIPTGEVGTSDAAFWRVRTAGERLHLRVQRASDGSVEEVDQPIRPPLTLPDVQVFFIPITLWALISLAVSVFVALARPDEPAARPMLVAGVAVALSVPPEVWINLPDAHWDLGFRAGNFLPEVAAVAWLHLFLIYPSPHPVMRRLWRFGPALLRPIGGGALVLDGCLVALAFALTAGPIPTISVGYLVIIGCVLAILVLVVRSYRHPAAPLVRAQLQWIFWGFAIWGVFIGALLVTNLLAGESTHTLLRVATVLSATLVPLSIGFSILRYRLFDVQRVVRDSVAYGLLTALLVAGFFAISFVANAAVAAVLGSISPSLSSTIGVLVAAALAVLAIPLERRLQLGLDGLIYRAQVARRKFLQEADEFLSRAQSIDALARFLTDETMRRLDLAGAWLVLPPTLAQPTPLPGSLDSLVDQLAGLREPVIISQEDLSPSAVAYLPATTPALRPWYDAGARLLVPLHSTSDSVDARSGPSDSLVGVWALGGFRSGDLPERSDLAAAGRIGRQAALLIDNARLNAEQVRQVLVKQDLERARQIQERLLPLPEFHWPGLLDVAAHLRPAGEGSGDFYDIFPLSPLGAGDGRGGRYRPVQIAVGDVQGKGLGAALVTAVALGTLRTSAERLLTMDHREPDPAATLSFAGRLLHGSIGQMDFVACALVVVDPPDATTVGPAGLDARVASAGQIWPLLCHDGLVGEIVPSRDDLPLGVLPNPDYRARALRLMPGDLVVLATDGLLEVPAGDSRALAPAGRADGPVQLRPPQYPGEFLGFERLADLVGYWGSRAGSARDALDGIWADVKAWCDPSLLSDDATLVVIRIPRPAPTN